MDRNSLIQFIQSDTRYTWRTLSAISYRFGCSLSDVDEVVASHPGTFVSKCGRQGVMLGVAGQTR